VAIALALLVGCAEQEFYPSADVPQNLILSGVTVVDTATGELTPNMTIVINDGVITSVSPEPAPDSSKLRIKLRIDATGKFLVPGYLDMHAHTLQSKSLKGDLSLMLANGITGFRQMAGSAAMIRQVKAGSFRPLRRRRCSSPAQFCFRNSRVHPKRWSRKSKSSTRLALTSSRWWTQGRRHFMRR